MFIAALFTVVKTWKQPSIDRGMDEEEVVHMYTMEYNSAIKNEIMPFAPTWMDLRDYLTK